MKGFRSAYYWDYGKPLASIELEPLDELGPLGSQDTTMIWDWQNPISQRKG